MTTAAEPLIIVGASTRSAAASCRRAGFRPICFDLFADMDLRQWGEVYHLSRLEEAASVITAQVPPSREVPVLYTGGVENHPELIEELSACYSLWGSSADAVRRVRQPEQLERILRDNDLPALDICRDPPSEPAGWLQKPLRSGGGLGIKWWQPHLEPADYSAADWYFQRYRAGRSMSALYAVSQAEDRCELLGTCRQLIGWESPACSPFAWCGSVGPIEVSTTTFSLLERLGAVLASECGLRGLFGVDFILDECEIPWVTEVNPRYTGSTEVLEHALGFHAILHAAKDRAATTVQRVPRPASQGGVVSWTSRVVAKGVLFAERDLCADTQSWEATTWNAALPCLVDLPPHRSRIASGSPICTLLMDCSPGESGLNELRSEMRALRDRTASW